MERVSDQVKSAPSRKRVEPQGQGFNSTTAPPGIDTNGETNYMKKILTILALSLIGLAGCIVDPAGNSNNTRGQLEYCDAVEYGNGVYYFPCISYKFANSIVLFKKPGIVITAISPNNTGSYGSTLGYFVVTEPTNNLK